MSLSSYSRLTPVALAGGMVTNRNPAVLNPGAFSMAKNIRPSHPGFTKRPGMIKLHTTADSTNKVLSLHQFRKIRNVENALFAQMSDGDILQATANPPAVTTGEFGTEVFSGSASQRPASWSSIRDILIMSNGVDQHQLYVGQGNYVEGAYVYSSVSAAPALPSSGLDYTLYASDGESTEVELGALGTNATDRLFIFCPVRANRLSFTVVDVNSANVSAELYYRKSDKTWALTTVTADANDSTNTGTSTLAQSGSMYWTPPADEIPCYMYGKSGFWYALKFDSALSANTSVSKITYGTDGSASGTRRSFLDLVNVWDGLPTDLIEARIYTTSTESYATYGTGSIALGVRAFDENSKLYLFSFEPLEGIYVDVGETPNTDITADAAISTIKYWNGTALASVSSVNDGTVGSGTATLGNSGWITWKRPTDEQPRQFKDSMYQAYGYEIILDDSISTDVYIAVQGMPYFNITEAGKGVCNASWNKRTAYAFNHYGQFVYVSAKDRPQVLNGYDYGVIEVGDGRSNQILAMHHFYDELITWQEEKGKEGGCTTLIEGYSPSTYGKLVLSTSIGILNSKCHALVDGVLTSTATEEKLKTLMFWLSRYGLCVTDGRVISIISDDVSNYFDPTSTDCIRRGYEDQHWLSYDSTFNIIRLGLVSGSSATVPNVFLAFDLTDKGWYLDDLAQELSCSIEVEAASGNVSTSQIGGGVDDGFIYLLNSGQNDVTTAVDSILDIEFHANGQDIFLGDLLLQVAAQTAGDVSLSVYANKVLQFTDTLSMIAENASETIRKHLEHYNTEGQLITLRFEHSTADQDMELYNLGVELFIWEGV